MYEVTSTLLFLDKLFSMRNYLFVALLCVLPSLAGAQITITNADMPSVGDSVRISIAVTTGSVDHTLTDTNFVWDFSSLAPVAQERIEFITPTAFPLNFFSDFGVTNYTPDSLPGIGSLPTNFTDYYKSTSSSYRQVGSSFDFAPIGSFSIPIIYSSPDYVYEFPLNYGNVDTSDAAYSLTIPGLGFIGQDKHRESTVDGWGILITPFDTFQVLRIRSVVDATDTVSLDTTNPGFTIVRPTEVQYKWLAPGMKYPVLEVDCQVIASAEVISRIAYQDSLRDGVFQVAVSESTSGIQQFSVYPNPSSDVIVVEGDRNSMAGMGYQIIDVNGRMVQNGQFGPQNQNGRQEINVSALTPGIYFLQMNGEGTMQTLKIVID